MNFSALSIKNPIPAIILFILLSLAGVLAFKFSAVQDFPDIELPMVIVTASLDGSSPTQMETEVARKLENAIATLEGIKHIYTSINDGLVTLTVEFILEKNAAEAVNDVRNAVDQVRADLPADVRDPSVTKVKNAGRAVLILTAASSQLDEQELSWFVDNTVTKKLLTVQGIGSIKRLGGVNREIQIELDPLKLAALHLSAAEVSRQLKQIQQEAAGGRGDISGAEQTVRTLGTVTDISGIAEIELTLRGQDNQPRKIHLAEIAKLSDTIAERRSLALADGQPVIGIEILRTRGASEVEVAQNVRASMQALNKSYPDVKLTALIDNTTSIQENFVGSMNMLYEGALLAVIVVWWFLRDWRATLITSAALPLSAIPSFLGMYYFGFSINLVTLLALSLVVGILVDDAIVEIENIFRHLRAGKSPYQASMEAADEIGLAVIATTFALVSVFLPTAFMSGIPGKFFKQFGWTAVFAILASLLVARLLTPMMSAYLLKPVVQHSQQDSGLMQFYMRCMRWCLRHRLTTCITAFILFAASISLIGLLPTGFVPSADRAQTQINIELPPGSTLYETQALAEQARERIQGLPEIKAVFSSVGGGSSGDAFAPGALAEVRRAILTVNVSHRNDRVKTLKMLEDEIRGLLVNIPGARFEVGAPDSGNKMLIVLYSEDPEALISSARAAERELRNLNGVGAVTSNASLVRPEIIIRPDFARAADMGVTAASIADTIRIATAGDYKINLSKLNLADRQVPIRVKLPDSYRADFEALQRLNIPGNKGPVQLFNVADISMGSGPAQIDRLDRSRNIRIDVELSQRSLGELYAEALNLPSLKNLPPTVKIAELGDAQEMQKLFSSFGLAMSIGLLCIYSVLVLLFKDFMQPMTILAALPLSIGGAFVALLITHSALSMPSMIGLVMLMGVVTKNSILLVEYAIVARREGMPRFDALVDACHKRSRPIVMTSIAMIAGMLPMAMGQGADPSFRAPMAITVIGGLITSTLLSLLVVPAAFTYIDDLKNLGKRLLRWCTASKAAE